MTLVDLRSKLGGALERGKAVVSRKLCICQDKIAPQMARSA